MSIAVEKTVDNYPALQKTGRWSSSNIQQDAIKLLKDTYVDDFTSGGCPADVKQMMG